jgi:hypothetical protein
MVYTVQPGDCLSSIGARYGFTWQTLWDLPENGNLRKLRGDPHVLNPGDQVFIPDLRQKDFDRQTDKRHRFSKKGVTEQLRIVFVDEDDKPVKNLPYVMVIDNKLTFQAQTDDKGAIEQKIPPAAQKGLLTVGRGKETRHYHFVLGGIDPITEIAGVKGRLLDLGYYDGTANRKIDSQVKSALLLFQDKYHLPPTAENDTPTQNKLKEIFGC